MTTLDRYDLDPFGPPLRTPDVHFPNGGRVKRTVREELVVNRPARVGPHPLAPPAFAAALLWLCVVVAAVALVARLIVLLFPL